MALQFGLGSFDYEKLRKHEFIIVVHNDAAKAAAFLGKLMRRHSFHTGNMFTTEESVAAGLSFPYPAEPITAIGDARDITRLANDIACRQSLHLPTAIDPAIQDEVKQHCNGDRAKEQKLLRLLKPAHFLPRRVFGNSIPEPVFGAINAFLLIPDAYLVFHHCLCSSRAGRNRALMNCLQRAGTGNQLLRIVTVTEEEAVTSIPSSLFLACTALFVFPGGREAHEDEQQQQQKEGVPSLAREEESRGRLFDKLWSKAKLNRVLDKKGSLHKVAAALLTAPTRGLVLRFKPANDRPWKTSSSPSPVDPTSVYWTTDIVHQTSHPFAAVA